MAELLLELLSEEIPARMQPRAAEDLKRLMGERLAAAGFEYTQIESYAAPRRLALVATGLPKRQADATEEKRGPQVGAPDKAIQGFLKANGLSSVDQAEVRETGKGRFYFAVRKTKGQATAKVLPGLIVETVQALSWPKSMRWAGHRLRWVRPLHGILAIFDGRRLSGALPLGDGGELRFVRATPGHRFLAPRKFSVSDFDDYRESLRRAHVVLDPAERRAEILRQAEARGAEAGLELQSDPGLLDELTGLVEWPVVLMGRIDPDFMDLPPEVLTTSMRTHQKYLALRRKDGRLADRFLMVADTETSDGGRTVVAGNERVLRARLADARFFWDQDRKEPLGEKAMRLREIVFHARLGTLDEKVDRVQALAVEIAHHVPGADADRVRSAARLAKADLVTGMVGEFPELQGIMGRYYALADGEHGDVAQAIAEHYAPQGPNDACPSAPVSVAVALADKIDTLVGFFTIDEKPTGSKDPYALRRAALGVIRLIVENRLRLPLRREIEETADLVRGSIRRAHLKAHKDRKVDGTLGVAAALCKAPGWGEIDTVVLAVLDFVADRLKVALREQGKRHDLISAVFALGGEDDLVRLLDRVEALQTFLASDDGANLLVAYQRAANIVRIEQKKDKASYRGDDLDVGKLVAPEERSLHQSLEASIAAGLSALGREDFVAAMAAISRNRAPIDEFFDRVTVNCDDPDLRANRLRLLARIDETLDRVADFSRIEG